MNNLYFDLPLITGKSNSTITKIGKLQNKKYRNNEKLFICDGVKLFEEAVKFNAVIKYIILDNEAEFDEKTLLMIKKSMNKTSVLCVDSANFKKLTTENAPQGIITICEYLCNINSFNSKLDFEKNNEKIIMLESVRDPGNMGTILRNAVAFGIDRLIISSDCADIYSPKVVRSSMGAIFKIKISVQNDFKMCIETLKSSGRRVLGAALKRDSLILGKDKISETDIFIMGNEGHGLSENIVNLCTDTIFIPMKENTESLNVSIASAILMWELSK